MILEVTTAAATEPISTAEMKLHSRVDIDTDDAKIAMLITAAREYVESVTSRVCTTVTYTLKLDGFPLDDFIEVPHAPLQSVTSISYVDTNGATQTLSSSYYSDETSQDGFGRIYIDRDVGWPSTYSQRNAVTIVYKAGYGDNANTVPERIVQVIALIAADWYENRESNLVGTIIAQVPGAVKSLLENLKVRGVPNIYTAGL